MNFIKDVLHFVTQIHGELGEDPEFCRGSEYNRRMYQGITSGKISTDSEAAIQLYGSEEITDTYRQQKHRFINSIVEFISTLPTDAAKLSNRRSAWWRASRKVQIIKLLMATGYLHSAASLARRTHQSIEKYEFTELMLECAKTMSLYLGLSGNKSELEKWDGLVKRYLKNYTIETELQSLSNNINSIFTQGWKIWNDNDKSFIDETRTKADKLISQCQTPNAYNYWFEISYKAYQGEDLLNLATKEKQWLQENQLFATKGKFARVHMVRAGVFYHRQQPAAGLKEIQIAIEVCTAGSFTWFSAMEIAFVLAMQNKEYDQASYYLRMVTGNRQFVNIDPSRRRRWLLFELFLRVVAPESFKTNATLLPFDSWNAEKFLELSYEKDKTGGNVLVLITQFIWLLRSFHDTGNVYTFDVLLSKARSLNQYVKSYLTTNETRRSQAFLWFLRDTVDAEFDPHKCSVKARGFERRIKNYAPIITENYHALEVVPYEELCAIILDLVTKINHRGYLAKVYSA